MLNWTRATNPQRVLIVEDNRDAADTLADLLSIIGYNVRVAYDGLEGVKLAREFRPQAVLCDVGLPALDGYEVARNLRNSGGDFELMIAITGYGSEIDKQKAADAGFDRHLVKPVDPDRLLQELGARSGLP